MEGVSIFKTFSSSSIKDAGILLEAIEIGNEPDLYSSNGARPPTYNVSQYVAECVRSRCQSLLGVLTLPTLSRFARWINNANILYSPSLKFWGASFGMSSHSTSGFSPQAILEEGITSEVPGSRITTYVCFLTHTRRPSLLKYSFVA